jgi:hypothetical protein
MASQFLGPIRFQCIYIGQTICRGAIGFVLTSPPSYGLRLWLNWAWPSYGIKENVTRTLYDILFMTPMANKKFLQTNLWCMVYISSCRLVELLFIHSP